MDITSHITYKQTNIRLAPFFFKLRSKWFLKNGIPSNIVQLS